MTMMTPIAGSRYSSSSFVTFSQQPYTQTGGITYSLSFISDRLHWKLQQKKHKVMLLSVGGNASKIKIGGENVLNRQ